VLISATFVFAGVWQLDKHKAHTAAQQTVVALEITQFVSALQNFTNYFGAC
jgi:hypothetical protein